MGACYIVMSLFPSQMTAIVCIALLGLMWPTYFCYFYTRCTELVPAAKAGTATSIVALSDGLAATACSYLLTGCMGLMGTMPSAPGSSRASSCSPPGVVSLVALHGFEGQEERLGAFQLAEPESGLEPSLKAR